MPNLHLTELLPHRGTALWLSAITEHDTQQISGTCTQQCLSQLSAAHNAYFFEAAAQLCAAHGALYAKQDTVSDAYIGKLSKLKVYPQHTPCREPIQITAVQQSANESSALYHFTAKQNQQLLLEGSVLLVLNHA